MENQDHDLLIKLNEKATEILRRISIQEEVVAKLDVRVSNRIETIVRDEGIEHGNIIKRIERLENFRYLLLGIWSLGTVVLNVLFHYYPGL